MSNPEFQFNFKFKLHKSNISIGLADDDYARLSVAYGVPLAEMMAEVDADAASNAAEAALLLKTHPDAPEALRGVRLAFMGDSITSDRRSYLNIIRTAIGDSAEILDDSISAYKINDIITNYVPGLTGFGANIAHLMIGSNDMKRTTDGRGYILTEPDEFRRELRYFLEALTARGTRLIVSTLPPFDAPKSEAKFWNVNVRYREADRAAYNAVIREEVERAGCTLNDMEPVYAAYTTDALTRDDGLHLNELGQRLMAEAVLGKMLALAQILHGD